MAVHRSGCHREPAHRWPGGDVLARRRVLPRIPGPHAYRRRMRQLRFVSLTEEDGHALLETTDGLERFTLPVDAALRDAVRADLPRLTPTATTPTPPEPAAAPG